MTDTFKRALCLHMIDATERGTGLTAFDPVPPVTSGMKLFAVAVIVGVAFLVGRFWGAM